MSHLNATTGKPGVIYYSVEHERLKWSNGAVFAFAPLVATAGCMAIVANAENFFVVLFVVLLSLGFFGQYVIAGNLDRSRELRSIRDTIDRALNVLEELGEMKGVDKEHIVAYMADTRIVATRLADGVWMLREINGDDVSSTMTVMRYKVTRGDRPGDPMPRAYFPQFKNIVDAIIASNLIRPIAERNKLKAVVSD